VLWKPGFLPPAYAWIVRANPFAIFLTLLRDPLLGLAAPAYAWTCAAALTAALLLATLLAAGTVRRRLIYWL
jgi:lipopolysaccharide transport system permease protein